MFTGLIEDVGILKVHEAHSAGTHLHFETKLAPEISQGDSIAVNGVCLTASAVNASGFEAQVMSHTLAVTALGWVIAGDPVNLELAMKASDRLGGHIVQGHVDGVVEVLSIEADGFARRLRVNLDPELSRYIVEKGSIALNGVSLTVAGLSRSWAEVSLIPETLERTNLGKAEPGDKLNVECDVVAKYVERLMTPFVGEEPA